MKVGVSADYPHQNVDINFAVNTTEKLGPSANDLHAYPHFFVNKGGMPAGHPERQKDTVSTVSTKRRTLSIIDKNGKPLHSAKNPLKSPQPFPQTEYNKNFSQFENLITKRIADRQ